jgi:Flp pilus assembly secretin CpaC
LLSLSRCWPQPAPAPVEPLTVIKSQHLRLSVPQDIQRIAVGDIEIAFAEVINTRELLLLGKAPGRTSLIVWFRTGEIQDYLVTVQRDLSVLQAALYRIDPRITVQVAPDRDALVLAGVVRDIVAYRAAEAAAQNYLNAGQSRVVLVEAATRVPAGSVTQPEAPQPQQAQPGQPQQPSAQPPAASIRVPVTLPPAGTVINLLQLETLPPLAEQKIVEAIRGIGGTNVSIRRILRGPVRDDTNDVLVLEGSVPNQVALVRILTIAAQIFAAQNITEEDIHALADEAGALAGRTQDQGQQGSFFGGAGAGSLFGGSGNNASRSLTNQVRKNIARAKVISAAGGKILSFLHVADLPQVRVDIRLYEVNRNKLRTFNPNSVALLSDFRPRSFNPAGSAAAVQDGAAARVGANGRSQIQEVLSFLGGTLGNQLQFTTKWFALDTAFSLLERIGLARSLSSPSLTVLSGELAQFQVGGEVPVPEAFFPILGGANAANGIANGIFSSVFFLPFGIQLGVRPLVEDGDMITLDLIPQVITPDASLTTSIRESTGSNLSATAFRTRSLRTSSRLQDGQALVIGGLLSRDTNDTQTATPGLRDVPGLGWLFKSFDRTDNGVELVVVVNPVVVRLPSPAVPMWEFPGSVELMRGQGPEKPTPGGS